MIGDKDFRIQKKRVQKLLAKWITPLGLRWPRKVLHPRGVPKARRLKIIKAVKEVVDERKASVKR